MGRRKYTNFRWIYKSEQIASPSYSKLAIYRNSANLTNDLVYVKSDMDIAVGIAISYRRDTDSSLHGQFATDTIPFRHKEQIVRIRLLIE